jgi:PAS domain S-box-containing protein
VDAGWRRLAFEQNPLPMCLIDAERGTIVDANWRMLGVLGILASDMGRASASELLGWRPHQGTVRGRVVRYRASSGGRRTAVASFEPLVLEGRHVVICVLEDVTQQEQALKRDERRLRTLGRASNQIFFAVDRRRRSVKVPGLTDSDTHAWYRFTGQTPGDASGRRWLDAVHPDDLPALRQTWGRAQTECGLFTAECRMRRADGEYRLMEIRAMPEFDDAGDICEWMGTLTDITERRDAQEDITRVNLGLWLMAEVGAIAGADLDYERTRQRLAGVMVPTFAHICILDLREDGAVRRVAVRHRDAEHAASVEDLRLSPPDLDNPEDVMTQVIESGEAQFLPELTDQDLINTARSERHLRALRDLGITSVMRVPLATSGRPFGAMAFMLVDGEYRYDERDLELAQELARRVALSIENARLYTEGRKTEQRLREANGVKDEFLGMMSHELRTPITVVRGGAQVLHTRSKQMTSAERDQLARDIEQEATRLARMLDDLLALSRLEFDQLPELDPVLMERVVPAAIREHTTAELAERVRVTMGEDLPIVYADAGYIGHILGNLLSNAGKYSPPDTTIDVVVEREGDGVIVRVLDRGPGVPAADFEHLFERFFRSEKTAGLAGGAGLGLPVCKRLVDAMSGSIWAKQREGGGFEVGFSLPLAPAPPEPHSTEGPA